MPHARPPERILFDIFPLRLQKSPPVRMSFSKSAIARAQRFSDLVRTQKAASTFRESVAANEAFLSGFFDKEKGGGYWKTKSIRRRALLVLGRFFLLLQRAENFLNGVETARLYVPDSIETDRATALEFLVELVKSNSVNSSFSVASWNAAVSEAMECFIRCGFRFAREIEDSCHYLVPLSRNAQPSAKELLRIKFDEIVTKWGAAVAAFENTVNHYSSFEGEVMYETESEQKYYEKYYDAHGRPNRSLARAVLKIMEEDRDKTAK